MRAEPIKFHLKAAIVLLMVLMFVMLALLRSALDGGRSGFDLARGFLLPYLIILNMAAMGWGAWTALQKKTPSDIRVILAALAVGTAIVTLTFALI
jgi:hypothetical protein